MVNVTLTIHSDPLRDLALSYAPMGRRAGLDALFALDGALGQVMRTTREPMVGQMRLAWWREALETLDNAPAPAEPVLRALAADVLPGGVSGRDLALLVDGWEPLLGDLDLEAIEQHARWRGAHLFELAGRVLDTGRRDPLTDAGRAWALDDLARHLGDPVPAGLARRQSLEPGNRVAGARWSRAGRPLGALAIIARRGARSDGAQLVLRLAWFRLTGR